MSSRDTPGDLQKDLEKFREFRNRDGGLTTSVPSLLELAFGSLTALLGIVWLVSLWWVPDVIAGETWMGLGILGIVLVGLPFLAIYWFRRGGIDVLRALLREVVG